MIGFCISWITIYFHWCTAKFYASLQWVLVLAKVTCDCISQSYRPFSVLRALLAVLLTLLSFLKCLLSSPTWDHVFLWMPLTWLLGFHITAPIYLLNYLYTLLWWSQSIIDHLYKDDQQIYICSSDFIPSLYLHTSKKVRPKVW